MSSFITRINYGALGAQALPFLGSLPSNYIMKDVHRGGFYDALDKPSWRPPKWVFGPVWTGLFTSMGYASYLVYRDGGGFNGPAKIPLALYGTQLALNWAWTPIFFGARKLKWGFIEMGCLWTAVAATGVAFYRVNETAGYFFIPYQAWLTLASIISYKIWRANGDNAEKAIARMKKG